MAQTDYVEFGSERHAQMLGLRKVAKDEENAHAYKGWTLVDPTQWGPMAQSDYIQAQLIQRVNELSSKPTVPANAQKMWEP